MTWARCLRDSRPVMVIVENAPRFPVALLEATFGDLYDVQDVVLDASLMEAGATETAVLRVDSSACCVIGSPSQGVAECNKRRCLHPEQLVGLVCASGSGRWFFPMCSATGCRVSRRLPGQHRGV